jgi:hypothetical protein
MVAVVRFTTLLALLANLIVPQYVLKYSPCCYDENGNLTFACSASNPASDTKTTSIKTRRTCCDPIKITLRGNPAPQSNDAQASVAPDTQWVALHLPHMDLGLNLGRDIRILCTATTGPPLFADVLTLHSRLNL